MTGKTGAADPGQPVQGAAAFSKYMVVLQAVADEPGRMDIARLVKALPFPRGTLYRLLAALSAEGLVVQNPETGAYGLGPRLISLAAKSWERSDLRSLARPAIEKLWRATGETVHLAVPSGNAMVYIDKLESANAVRMMTSIGGRVELHSTSVGKAWMAGLPDERLKALLAGLELPHRTANTFTTPPALFDELLRTRAQGYAFDNEENEPDIRCLGATVFSRLGEPAGAVSVSMPVYRYDDERHRRYAALVRTAAAEATAALATLP